MAEPPPGEDLVEAIRQLGLTLHARDFDDETGRVVKDHLDAARAALVGGTARLRWYEADPTGFDSAKPVGPSRNRDLSTFSGRLNAIAPPMRVSRGALDDGRPALIGRVRLDRLREGPPRSVHGGVIAGLFDELLGGGQRLEGGPPGMTARLTVRYRRPTPLDAELELRAWIHDERVRRVIVRADCRVVAETTSDSRPITAEAEAVFLRVDFARLDEMMRDRPDGDTPGPAPATDDR